MEPAERKKRILIGLAGAAVVLAFLGNFFWTFSKHFLPALSSGSKSSKVPLLIFGGFFGLIALAIVFSVVRGIRKAIRPEPPPAREEKPWLKRADWAAGRIKSSATAQTKIFVIFSLAFGGFGGLMTFLVLPKELHNGNDKALFILLFPAIGLGFVIAIVRGIFARRRFGDCFFEMAAIPGALGGTLEGLIQTGARLRLEHGLHLKLSCVRRIVNNVGDNQNVQENILWQDEKVFAPNADLPEPEPGRSGIPVFFKLPADQPECFARGNESILWRLEAKAKMSGPNFSARFDVPVFKVAGAAIAEDAAEETDPTAALQMPVEELRRDEHSKIQITDGPRGREFYFPAARNLGMAFMLTVFFVVWSGFLWLMTVKGAPVMFPIVFGFFDILILWGLLNAWFKSSRVTVDATSIHAVNRWLLFTRARNFAAAEVERIETKVGMTSGNQAYQDLQVVTRAGKKLTVAGGLASKPEADWLVQEMSKALGRRA